MWFVEIFVLIRLSYGHQKLRYLEILLHYSSANSIQVLINLNVWLLNLEQNDPESARHKDKTTQGIAARGSQTVKHVLSELEDDFFIPL